MRKTVFTCDHCGKELDEMHDYTEMKIDNFDDIVEVDLCLDCYNKLDDMVMRFVNKKTNI